MPVLLPLLASKVVSHSRIQQALLSEGRSCRQIPLSQRRKPEEPLRASSCGRRMPCTGFKTVHWLRLTWSLRNLRIRLTMTLDSLRCKAESCMCSLLTLRGRSSQSTMPRRNHSHFGRRSVALFLTSTRRDNRDTPLSRGPVWNRRFGGSAGKYKTDCKLQKGSKRLNRNKLTTNVLKRHPEEKRHG